MTTIGMEGYTQALRRVMEEYKLRVPTYADSSRRCRLDRIELTKEMIQFLAGHCPGKGNGDNLNEFFNDISEESAIYKSLKGKKCASDVIKDNMAAMWKKKNEEPGFPTSQKKEDAEWKTNFLAPVAKSYTKTQLEEMGFLDVKKRVFENAKKIFSPE